MSVVPLLAAVAAVGAAAAHARAVARRRWRELQALVLVDLLAAALLGAALASRDQFARWMQEDGWAEWATFYAFAGAALAFTRLVAVDRTPWSRLGAVGLALFCAFVAGEEISWGQRLFAFEPPELFLSANYQQELNLHNLLMNHRIGAVQLESRWLVAMIAVGFGLVAPALARLRWIGRRRWGRQLGALCPPVALAPWFALVALAEQRYPLSYTGEACELVLGVLFLHTALLAAAPAHLGRIPPLAAGAVLLVLAVATGPLLSTFVYGTDRERAAQTRGEIAQLASDLPAATTRKLARMRSVHKRLYTATRAGYFRFGDASAFLDYQGSPAERDATAARRDRKGYFLDPWNSPYWVRWRRSRNLLVVYSFGPNRRRDTDFALHGDRFRLAGDDLAALIQLSAR